MSDENKSGAEIKTGTGTGTETETGVKNKIVNSKGAVLVKDYEEKVAKYCVNEAFFKSLKADQERKKEEFRSVALAVCASETGDSVRSVEFYAGSGGGSVSVSMCDVEKASSRLKLNSSIDIKSLALELNCEVSDLVESKSSYRLSGAFVDRMDAICASEYIAKGLPIPSDIVKETVERLSVKGVEMLRAAGKHVEVASALRSPTVSIKK